MPPFSFQALVRAEARTQEVAQGFLNAASTGAQDTLAAREGFEEVMRAHHPVWRGGP
jgi:primosomal protein N' (replication factor Y)